MSLDFEKLSNVLESIMADPNYQVGVNPEELFSTILSDLKMISTFLQDPSKTPDVNLDEIYSGLHEINVLLSNLTEKFPLEENYGTEGMEPKRDENGFPDYSDPNGSSFAARNGFLG